LTNKLSLHKGQGLGPASIVNVNIKLSILLQDNVYLLYILYKGAFQQSLSSVLGYVAEL